MAIEREITWKLAVGRVCLIDKHTSLVSMTGVEFPHCPCVLNTLNKVHLTRVSAGAVWVIIIEAVESTNFTFYYNIFSHFTITVKRLLIPH